MTKNRTRQVFDAAFKMDAVQEMRTRVASGVPVSVIARDRQVRPEQLRAWAKQLELRAGQAPTDVFSGEGNTR
ncbi:MAG: transposase [Gemmatimonas sp.]